MWANAFVWENMISYVMSPITFPVKGYIVNIVGSGAAYPVCHILKTKQSQEPLATPDTGGWFSNLATE